MGSFTLQGMASASMATPIEIEDFVALSPAPPAVADSADGASDVEHGEVPTNMTPRSPMAVASAPQTTQTALEPHEPGAATQPTGIDNDQPSDGELGTSRVTILLRRIMDLIVESKNAATAHRNSIDTRLSSLEAKMDNIGMKMDSIEANVDNIETKAENSMTKRNTANYILDDIDNKLHALMDSPKLATTTKRKTQDARDHEEARKVMRRAY